MKPRFWLYVLALVAVFLISQLANAQREPAPDTPADSSWPEPMVIVDSTYKGRTAQGWFVRYQQMRRYVTRRWMPTVNYALRLASAVSGVSYWELRSVSWCESRHWPFARNGRYLGLFQLGWVPFRIFSPFDPVANALSAALTVRHDGSWRQWECRPHR